LERTSENGGSYFNNSRKCFFCWETPIKLDFFKLSVLEVFYC
jgi:hypothetical protein